MDLILAKEVVAKLKQGGSADISTAYFSKLVKMGVIPYHTQPGKKRKMFKYDEAKKALLRSQDPSRDSQREANALAKENKKLEEQNNKTQNSLDKAGEIYSKCLEYTEIIRLLSKDDHLKLLDKEAVGDDNVNEHYSLDRETNMINITMLDLISEYLSYVKNNKEKTKHDLDRFIKLLLVSYLLDKDFYSIDFDKLKQE